MIFIYILGGIFALFIGMQLFVVYSSKKAQGTQLKGLKGNLQVLEKSGSSGLVYFYSPQCHACRATTPVIKQLQKKHKNVFDVDVSKDYSAAGVFGVKATPTTVLVKDGIVKNVFLGAKPAQFMENLITW